VLLLCKGDVSPEASPRSVPFHLKRPREASGIKYGVPRIRIRIFLVDIIQGDATIFNGSLKSNNAV